jgi:hypothetical protein
VTPPFVPTAFAESGHRPASISTNVASTRAGASLLTCWADDFWADVATEADVLEVAEPAVAELSES